ncbi:late competence development ComFB family protein [Acidithiobacillus ferrooxidans]|uniref:late competence development ComFB family protein n=1 Tax=Acidithiobacillus ferrooxidans TaxID=920 RepID=UPI0035A5DE18
MTRPKNYFESICYKYISQCVEDEDMIFDAMAIALNSLPPKYYRDEQSMGSFLTNEKIEYFNLLAEQACKRAIHYVSINKRWKPHGDIN